VLALMPSRGAQADTNFTNFRFPAAGAPTARTMPDRLGDVINVKDWGAVGDGSRDDTAAIQAAIDHAVGLGSTGAYGGTVFFPVGVYHITESITVTSQSSLRLIGSGKQSSILSGKTSGYFLYFPAQKGGGGPNAISHIEGLGIKNYSTAAGSGGIYVGYNDKAFSIVDCYV